MAAEFADMLTGNPISAVALISRVGAHLVQKINRPNAFVPVTS
jgi:hypothetical protein